MSEDTKAGLPRDSNGGAAMFASVAAPSRLGFVVTRSEVRGREGVAAVATVLAVDHFPTFRLSKQPSHESYLVVRRLNLNETEEVGRTSDVALVWEGTSWCREWEDMTTFVVRMVPRLAQYSTMEGIECDLMRIATARRCRLVVGRQSWKRVAVLYPTPADVVAICLLNVAQGWCFPCSAIHLNSSVELLQVVRAVLEKT